MPKINVNPLDSMNIKSPYKIPLTTEKIKYSMIETLSNVVCVYRFKFFFREHWTPENSKFINIDLKTNHRNTFII